MNTHTLYESHFTIDIRDFFMKDVYFKIFYDAGYKYISLFHKTEKSAEGKMLVEGTQI